MNIKSLLIGSAAALAAVSLAYAAPSPGEGAGTPRDIVYDISPGGGGGGGGHKLGVDIGAQAAFSNEVGIITSDPFPGGHIKARGDEISFTAALEDPGPKIDKLASNETSIIEPDAGSVFHVASLPQGGLIIEHEGDGGMKKPNLLGKTQIKI